MPRRDFAELPDDARCWVFAADRPLDASAANQLLALTDDYLAQWRAHGAPLASARDWRDDHFLAVAVDERAAGASGCSVDALFRSLKSAEPMLGATFVSGSTIFWRGSDGRVMATPRVEFVDMLGHGAIGDDTPVFDPTLTTVGQWRSAFERPLLGSWQGRLRANVRTV
jgi:hypothetical protein